MVLSITGIPLQLGCVWWFGVPFLQYMTCSSGPWGSQSPFPGTPASYAHMSPQRLATPSTYAAMPGSNQPYTCFVCNATATSKKNYIAHLQVSLHPPHAVLLATCAPVGLYLFAALVSCGVLWCVSIFFIVLVSDL